MKKRLLAMLLSIVMIVSMVPLSALPVFAAPTAQAAHGVMQNTDQNKGVVFAKSAQLHLDEHGNPDGTVDIVLHAYTTGAVTTTNVITPTDIVLVLDLSGSMDDAQSSTQQTVYTPVYATETLASGGWFGSDYHTGLNTNSTRYVMTAPDTYASARRTSNDDNGHEVWYYTDANNSRVYFYPAFEDANFVPEEPYENTSYPVIQVYTRTTQTITGAKKIDLLKTAVDEFIANTAEFNEGVDPAKMHRISIVKFASDDYADPDNLLDEGNDTYRSGGNTYNYSQVVKNLTVVDDAGKTELITAMDSLNPGGATAVDYGVTLAEAVFDAQDEAYMQGRKKVVIVFTDGSPTYGSAYQEAVAGAAINHANALKAEGVTVYTIGVEAGADASQLGSSDSNRFMHYLSSNYPNASYANGTITEGTGGPEGGYYLTPDSTQSLDMIFQKISEDIAAPSISLGEEATVVDAVSEYFTISDKINAIQVYTADKLAGDAWAEPELDTSIVPTVVGNTVSVNGFDFDANFVSSERRTVGGKDFWGRTLILVINTTPDYDKIDIHAADIAAADGVAYTNEGKAEIVKNNEVITSVGSPEIQLNKVTYTVDGSNYKEFYRLPGGVHTVIAAPTKTGATFSGWSTQTAGVDLSTGAFTMPQSDVTIAGTFTDIDYTVSYDYVGLDLGAAMPALPQSHTAVYGQNVTVAQTPTLTGYTFVGWYPQDEALGTGNLTSFSMPAHNVVLLGRFVPNTGTAYKVEHYTETFTDGHFELKETENLAGTTGETAYAAAKNYVGFTHDANYAGTVASGTIAADGSLTLKLYYTRNSYEVTYEYVGDKVPRGTAPAGTIGTPIASYTQTYKYGADVTVKPDATAPGYTFTGWYSTGGTVKVDTVSFAMPDHAVTLRGYFSANNNTAYKVEHYFENANDTNYTIDNNLTEYFTNATTDTTVTALPLNIQGFKCDTTVTDTVESGVVNGEGTLTLKLYYKRNTYEVTYEYVGDKVPTGAAPAGSIGTPIASYTQIYKYGADVTVKPDASAPGYTFTGWYSTGGTVKNDTVSFKMPDHAVTLRGYFSANTNTAYKIEHYFENVNDANYTINDALTEHFTNATTDTTVSALPLNIQGFKCDTTIPGTVESGVVNGEGTLTLKLYYKRNTYKVVYDYEGFVPADANPTKADLADATATYKWGQTVTVMDAVNNPTDYTFHGWYRNGDASRNIINGTTFEMPQEDVLILGHFDKTGGIEYYVEHYFQDINGNYVHNAAYDETFKGTSGETVTATPVTVTGYHHNASYLPERASGTVPGPHDGVDLKLELYYDLNEYTVTYKFEGVVPADAVGKEPAAETYHFSEEVTVAGAVSAKGYTFVGWYRNNDATKTPITKFDMPANNVELVGMFVANTNTAYKVEHYFEDAAGNYVIDDSKTQNLEGTTGTSVTATPLGVEGFTYNSAKSEATRTGIVAGDGSTTLKLYYDLNEYTVTYKFEGFVPADAVGKVPAAETHLFSEEVTVAGAVSAKGYTFVGWYRNNDATKTPITKFDMPAYNVEFVGMFVANTDTKYTVEHYFEDADGNYVIDNSKTQTPTATTGTSVTATPLGVEGFTYNSAMSAATRTGTVAGDGSTTLKLYYNRNKFTVTYVYTVAPAGVTPPTPHTDVPWGDEVTLNPAADVPGYTFSGWSIKDVTITGGKFEMPKANVTVVGSYSANDYNYKIEHWVETDSGFELHGASEVRVGKMDAAVTALSHVIHGYTYDADVTVSENAKNGIEIGDGKAIKFGNSDRTTLRSVIKDGNLVLAFYYTRNEYDVTYVIEGAVKPEGVTAPAKQTDVPFATNVDVEDALNVPGYTFSGWTTDDADVNGGKFSMPDNDVVFTGSFTADSVNYKIKYWHQSLSATGEKEYKGKQYDEVTADEETLSAITGHAVSAYPDYIKVYEGLDPRVDQDEFSGTVKGDGSLVLNVYYDREVYDVTYIYVGFLPEDAPAIPTSYNKTGVMYGAELEVEDKMADYSDRKFDGWHSTDVNITNNAAKFTMPAKNVTIYGKYVPADSNDYTVTYFVDGKQHAQYVVKPGDVHVIIDEPTGATAFKGWSDPLNVAKNQFVVTTDDEFIMPWSDVEIYGEFEAPVIPIIPRGALSIEKIAVTPNDFLGTNEYTFDIYSVGGNVMTPVAVLTVKGGTIETIALKPGTYYVTERDASVNGYELVTECSDADGFVTVAHANETTITFTNTYTEIMLQKDDHFAYIIGYPDGTVRPEASITRAEVATIFFRMMTDTARDHYWSTTNTFSDVKESDWYNTAISTLAKAGVLNGYTDGTFHPNATITRAELVKIATSFYDTDAGKSSEFSDVRDHWASTFIDEAQKLGIVSGYGDGTFHPDQAVTRAEAMKIVNRTLDRRPDKDHLLNSMIKWPDNMDTSKWYYAEVQEATNSHDYTNEDSYEIWTAILPVRDWAKLELAWKEEHDGE